MADAARRLGLFQAGSGAAAGLVVVGSYAMALALDDVEPPRGTEPALVAAAMLLFGAAMLAFRKGRRLAAPSPRAPLRLGELVVLLGCAVAAGAALWGIAADFLTWGNIEDADDESVLFWAIGIMVALVGHILLAIGMFRAPPATSGSAWSLRGLGLWPLFVPLAWIAFVSNLDSEYEGGERPFELGVIAWAVAWAAFHVVTGWMFMRSPPMAQDAERVVAAPAPPDPPAHPPSDPAGR